MRPGQQNKRGRGRGSNNGGGGGNNNNNNNFNRKGSNPLTRTYDSSGPDVKIRGTAQHIAEKYSQLGRDAQSSGDRVMAENYLQHAEHYNRIIAAAQAQMQERFQHQDRQDFNGQDSSDRDMDDMDGMDGDDQPVVVNAQPQPQPREQQPQPREQQPQTQVREQRPRQQREPAPVAEAAPARADDVIDGTGPQPVIDGIPAEVAIEEEASSAARQPRRRSPSSRPRRQPRAAKGEGDGENAAAGDESPALADAASE